MKSYSIYCIHLICEADTLIVDLLYRFIYSSKYICIYIVAYESTDSLKGILAVDIVFTHSHKLVYCLHRLERDRGCEMKNVRIRQTTVME